MSYSIDFIGTRATFNRASEPMRDASGKEIRATRHYSDDIGVTFKTVKGEKASYRFGRDELYVRARVTSTKSSIHPPCICTTSTTLFNAALTNTD